MNRFRRILIRREKKLENYLAFLHFVRAFITIGCAGLLEWALKEFLEIGVGSPVIVTLDIINAMC